MLSHFIRLIEETFTIKEYEGQRPVIGFIKDYRKKESS